ncbi:type IX secretion system PorP/SprF family membrane protein [Pontibacter aydingkolensis]|uniref:Type IX secretion system membrane protein PorP/SprF n=1 Tax=Pontibacter aydingkolensis TaxID=1911536 RepID=A0ABS7CTR0_9BACT|nr:type IX secretion system membrane protein PorP/SprF [Pontibacter aydingkolensis]MBW7467071.1 type IX secretion system membrane protein PorP/SprF [Pontibacter aydingkolensis]
MRTNDLRNKLLLVLLLLSAHVATAQQAPQYTQYIFNELVINPAYAGSKGILNINATYRSQWTGLEGAPITQTLSVDGPTSRSNIGWAGYIVNDKLGAQSQTGVYGNVSVRINLDRYTKLAFGVSAGAAQYTLDGTMLNTGSQTSDAAVPQGRETKILPDAKLGIFFNTERYYAGLTAANLIPFKSENLIITTPRRHYFLSTGYMFDLGNDMRLKPSILLKEDFHSPTNIDLNTFLLFSDRFWIGGSYRTSAPMFTNTEMKQLSKRNAAAALVQVYVTPRMRVGYSYDMSLNALNNYSSHEVSLGYSFFKKHGGRILTPRNL